MGYRCKKCSMYKMTDDQPCACNAKKFNEEKLSKKIGDTQKEREPIKKVSDKKKERIKNEGSETDIFKEIWSERPHSCVNCGKVLTTPKAHNFDHIIPKSRGKGYRLDKNNIQILCFSCHFEKTSGLEYKGIDLDL